MTPAAFSFNRASRVLFSAIAAVSALGYSYVSAADIIKANNTNPLSDTASWVGGVVPTSTDIAVFDSSLTSGGALPYTGNLSFGGIRSSGYTGSLSINGGPTQNLTLGTGGLDLSAGGAGSNFDLDTPLILAPASSQVWKAGAGVTSTLWSTLNLGAGTLMFDLSGANTGTFFAEGFGTVGQAVAGVVARDNTGTNFAALDGSRKIILADGLGVANPSDNGTVTAPADLISAPAAGSYLDVTNSNGLATATAFRALRFSTSDSGTYWNDAGIRFNQPHATAGTNWTVDVNQVIYPNSGVFSLLVTEGVGARSVIFTGAGNGFRFNNTGASMSIQQHNMQGDLIIRAPISARQLNNNFVKGGPGRLIMANSAYGASGTSAIYLAEGVTQLGENSAAGTFGNLPVTNNGTLRFQRSDAFDFGSVLSGAGSVTVAMSGTGSLTLSGVNTYTGPTVVESGSLTLANQAALGATSSLALNGGLVTFGAGVTADITSHPTTLGTTTTINTNGNNVVFSNPISQTAPSGLIKDGNGTLTLEAANTITGASSVNGGTLAITNVSGSATGSGSLTINNGTTLSGTGSVAGVVTVASGAKIAPGLGGVGSFSVGGLVLQSGSLLDFDVASTSSNDRVVVTGSGGLSISGGGINFYAAGTTNGLSTPGVYNIFQYTGAIGGSGVSALSVLNPQAGYKYTFSTSAGSVTLTVTEFGMITDWTKNGSGSFSDSQNWDGGIPTGDGATANFTASLGSPATVTLDGNRTLGGISFDSANGYTIAQGTSGTLYIDNGADVAAINILNGAHVISAPVGIVSNVSISTVANSSLSITGLVAGIGNVTKLGAGVLSVSNSNQIVGSTTVNGGTLEFGSLASIGNGSIELNGGALRYAAGNTADISARTVMIGVNGGGIDTNGNNVTFVNPIGNSGPGSLIKKGEGSLVLAVGNTYVGPTVIQGGQLSLSANNRLNANGVGITLDGGTLETTATFTTDRTITTNATNGTLSVAADTTLTVTPFLAGTGVLTKSGPGTLSLATTGATKSGGVTLAAGTINVAHNVNFGNTSSVLGGGSLTMSGGTLAHSHAAGNTLVYDNAFVGVANTRSRINTPNRFRWNSAVSGAGTLDVAVATTVARADLQNNFLAFGGDLNFTGSGTVRLGIVALASGQPNFNAAGWTNTTLSVDGVTIAPTTNSGGNTITIGALASTGAAGVMAGGTAGAPNYTIGAKLDAQNQPISTTYGGIFTGNAIVTKVGDGRLTLTNTNNVSTGAINANAGVLDLRGTFGPFYRSSGADGIAGNGDDYSSITEPTDGKPWTINQPGTVTIAAAGTLAGNGSLGGALTVNGKLQPDSTGTLGGNLRITGQGAFTLASSATTLIDLKGVVFTGVKSTSSGANTYGGLLKFNFLGTVFNGSYKVFDLATAPTGSFTGVSITTTASTETALNNSGSVWSGTVGLQSYSFDTSTGVLTVIGGADAVVPDVPAGLAAVAGNSQVALSWNAASNATSYIVKRATTAGGAYTSLPATATTSFTDTGLTNGTTYYYVVQAQNTASGLVSANSSEVSATPVAAPVHTALETWRFDQFGVYTDDGTVLAGDLEDFDGDGLVNLQEYAFGTNPKVANASPVVVGRNGDKLTLTYPRIADAKLTYTVQGRNDLTTGSWSNVDVKTGNAAGSTVVEDTALLSANPRRFLRLSVTYTP